MSSGLNSELQLLAELRGNTLWLTLNRPEIHNAFGDQLIAELTEALIAAETDDNVHAIVLTGAGKTFSAGADMNWMRNMAAASEIDNREDALRLATLLRTLNFHPKPTIARINGAAFGGGLGLIACCDIAISVADAVFALTEVRLGLVPAVISPYVIRRMGERQARRFFLTAERFDAARAMRVGLIREIATPEMLDNMIEQQLRWLSQGGPRAISEAKSLIFSVCGQSIEKQKELDQHTASLIARLRVSDEGQEGLAAFLEKRAPGWTVKDND
ncbi:MAG TPA: enoyl-CoA hydratase-related protein [Xanthomonadales bacterium]|nr:enoyl-CoA hydratase-related protein [Xanthomonadales bacterium]